MNASPPRRFGMVIALRKDKLERYKRLHADPWPGVREQIRRSRIRNYSIYLAELKPGEFYLFGSFEYTGDDFEADMAAMAADAETQRWWRETDPCQVRLPTAKAGEQWTRMEEVFHQE